MCVYVTVLYSTVHITCVNGTVDKLLNLHKCEMLYIKVHEWYFKKRSLYEILEPYSCNIIMDLYRCDKTGAK